MLKKLMKYELRATGRYFLPLFAALLALSAINRLFYSFNFTYVEVPQVILTLGVIALIVGVSVMTLVVTIQRFYKNLLTDEGYLSFTLPVKAGTHINCKMFVSLIWDFAAIIVIVLSILILCIDRDMISSLFSEELFQSFAKFFAAQTASKISLTILLLLLAIVVSLYFILKVYAAITIGSRSTRHKIILGVGVYIGFDIAEQTILFTSILTGATIFRNNPGWIAFIDDNLFLTLNLGLLLLIVYYAILGVVYYTVTHHCLSKRLNLE